MKRSAPKSSKSFPDADPRIVGGGNYGLSIGGKAMVVGVGHIVYRIHDCRSLKGKRKVVKAIVTRLRNRFNASVAEVDANDIHQKAVIGFCMVGNDRAVVNSKMDKLFNMAEDIGLAETIDMEMEIISL